VIVESVHVRGYRSIADSGPLPLGPVTIVIGRNNSGKSALLRAMYLMQQGAPFAISDVRLRENEYHVDLSLGSPRPPSIARLLDPGVLATGDLAFLVQGTKGGALQGRFHYNQGQAQNVSGPLAATRPHHLVVPVFARRKADNYESVVRQDLAQQVLPSDRNLTSRIATLMSGEHAEGLRYRELVKQVLGVPVATYLTDEGQQPGLPVSAHEGISLDRMGEGISSALTIITELANQGQRLFLVEEPETDLHPRALRALLDLMLESAGDNQFIVSTHSDLVLRHLGSADGARVYRSELSSVDGLPTSTYVPIEDQHERLSALSELGYESSIPSGWLVFEESTAERVVRDVLIPLFAPSLARLQTVGGHGAGDTPATVADLHRMLVFTHLTDRETPRAWVVLDGDEAGQEAARRLREQFKTWPPDRFRNLSSGSFEAYYPRRFRGDVAALAALHDSRARSRAKGALAARVAQWAADSPEEARTELAASASEVIELLKRVQAEFGALPLL
jgi:predicted ATPase